MVPQKKGQRKAPETTGTSGAGFTSVAAGKIMELQKEKELRDIPGLLGMPFAYGVTLLYVVLAGLWIYFSDQLMVLIARTPEQLLLLSTGKGWLFVACTALLLFFILLRFTAQVRGEQQRIRVAAERYRITLNAIGDGVIVADYQGRVQMLNPVAEALTGWRNEEAKNRPMQVVFDIINEETRQKVEDPTVKVLRQGVIVGLANHTLLIAKDGTERPIADSGAPIRDEDGAIMGVVLVFRDQTEERQAKTLMQNAYERLQIVMDSVDAAIYIADMQTHELLFVNEYAGRVWGNDVIGKKCWKVLQGADGPCSFCSNDKLVDEQGRPTGIYRWEFQNRVSGRWYDVRDRAITWLDGHLVRLEVAGDITERKEAEESLRERERDLQRAQALAHIGSWRIDLHTGKVSASQEAHRIYGLEEGDFTIKDIQAIPLPHYREMLDGALQDLVEKNQLYDIQFQICRVSDNVVRDIHSIAEYDAEKNIVIGIIHDISNRMHLEEQLRQAQKMESVGRLAGGVAHDFNNMLGVIQGHAELAMADIADDDPLRPHLVEIHEASRRSKEITRQLLAFARKQTIAPQILDFNETVSSLLTMLRRLIGEDIDLSWRSARGACWVKMDPSQVDQILANLCVNARDAIDGIGKITIETKTVQLTEEYCVDHADSVPGDYVLLAVSDDGSGMTRETMGRLFEPFFTTKDVGRGTGLGLATVYGIVRQNDGFINVYSEPGQGTTFKVYLPRYNGIVPESRPEAALETPRAQGETILIVEDETAILDLGRTLLERLDYTVLTAATPGRAKELAATHAGIIDMLVTDVVMPEMNGRDLAEELTAHYPRLKTLFMSGYTADVIAHHGVLEEGVHFLEKPFSAQDLAVKVRQVLEES